MDTPDGRGTVVELDLLRQRVKVRMEDRPESVSVFANSEIAILRNGKAKKNDPPIPADLAPISGAGKRRKLDLDAPMQLDAIKFRYSTETVAEETPIGQTAPGQEESAQSEGHSSSRRRRNRKPKAAATKPEAEKKPEEKPKASEESAGKKRRRNHHRRRKPQSGGES